MCFKTYDCVSVTKIFLFKRSGQKRRYGVLKKGKRNDQNKTRVVLQKLSKT